MRSQGAREAATAPLAAAGLSAPRGRADLHGAAGHQALLLPLVLPAGARPGPARRACTHVGPRRGGPRAVRAAAVALFLG